VPTEIVKIQQRTYFSCSFWRLWICCNGI